MNNDEWLKQMLAEEQRRRERLPAVKALLCEVLKARAITTVSITYDGEGDSGQINHIEAFDEKHQPMKLDKPVTLAIHKPEEPTNYGTLYEAVDDFAWTILGIYHDGFWDNGGGFGTIDIDVDEAKVTIDHNDRITDVANTVTEM